MPNTPFHTITELAALLKSQQLSPVEVTRALLERISQLDGRYKSYATVMADQALEAARVAEQEIRAGTYRGPLHGVPVAVKDLCFTKGIRTMGGTRALADHAPNFDATVVARLHAAGAIDHGVMRLGEHSAAALVAVDEVVGRHQRDVLASTCLLGTEMSSL